MPKTLADLQTPSLVLDLPKVRRNIDRMAARARELEVPLRPHLKTPKSVHIAKLLAEAGARGFNVSTLQEAEYFYEGGFEDLYYCVPFAPVKAARAAALAAKGCVLTLMTDSLEGAKAAVAAAEAVSPTTPLRFTLELDVDGYRSGMPWQGDDFIEAAQVLASSSATEFVGIMSYGGASYGKTPDGAADLTETHLAALRKTAARLETAGLSCSMISFGSTPAVLHARSIEGVTEARCGIYTFQDLFQAGIGACTVDDVSVSVLASVIARQPQHNRFVIDAGGLALSKDRSTAGHTFDAQYGLVCDAVTGKPIGDLAVTTVSQEIGLVTSLSGKEVDLSRFPVGSTVRILPNHADMTAAAYEDYFVVEGDDNITAHWTRRNYWA
ncbi:MAG: alanine racemase [Pseudomonadota bacterium]